MSHFPNQSYYGQYYFNPQWIPAAGGSQPSVVYNNVVNFTVGPDGTHYFHQTYSGQFVAPQGPTVDMKMVRYKIPPQQSTRAMRLYSPFRAGTKNPPLYIRDPRGAAKLRYRNRAKITVLFCDQKPYPFRTAQNLSGISSVNIT